MRRTRPANRARGPDCERLSRWKALAGIQANWQVILAARKARLAAGRGCYILNDREKSSTEIEPRAKHEQGAETWKRFQSEFRELADEEGRWRDGLSAHGRFGKHPPSAWAFNRHEISVDLANGLISTLPGISKGLEERYRTLATRAGIAFGCLQRSRALLALRTLSLFTQAQQKRSP